jgi:hypothetical protein
MADTEKAAALPKIPARAYLAGKGMCEVLTYDGNGYFTVLTNRDHRIFVHRNRLSFRKA